MKNLVPKIVLILTLIAICLWSVYPPQKKIRLGKDLQGGVSLVYSVSIPDSADADEPAGGSFAAAGSGEFGEVGVTVGKFG